MTFWSFDKFSLLDGYSFLQAEGQAISPHVVRKALENTALKVSECPDEPLTTGRGLLQVDK